jgi:CRISPR system Cascade subunit CasE
MERLGRATQILGYTSADRETLEAHAALADPAVHEALQLDKLSIKKMPTTFKKGMRLDFETRARPIIRQHLDGDRDTCRERDIFLVTIEKAGADAEVDRGEVYTDWLRSQIEQRGAAVVSSRLASMRRLKVARRDRERNLRDFDGPDATFTGTLAIEDPENFTQLRMLLLAPTRG